MCDVGVAGGVGAVCSFTYRTAAISQTTPASRGATSHRPAAPVPAAAPTSPTHGTGSALLCVWSVCGEVRVTVTNRDYAVKYAR